MRILSWFLSILLHAAVLALAVLAAQSQPRMIDLGVPVYQVDLVRLAKGRPARAVKAAPRPEPKPQAVPVARPEPKPEPKPEPVAKPEPKPEAKPVAAKEKEPEKKAEPEKKPEKKPAKPEPAKPEPSKEDILKQALARAQRDVKWKERQERKALERELQDLRRDVAEDDAAVAAGAENATGGDGAGGEDDITVTFGLVNIYSAQVVAAIRPNWRFPSLPGAEDLTARVRIRIAPDGTIREYMVTAPSGRPEFDASVLKAVEETRQLPRPPRPDLEYIDVNFNLSELQ